MDVNRREGGEGERVYRITKTRNIMCMLSTIGHFFGRHELLRYCSAFLLYRLIQSDLISPKSPGLQSYV
jgi:hypothetical protein